MSVDLQPDLNEPAPVLPGRTRRTTEVAFPSDAEKHAGEQPVQAVTGTRPVVPPKGEGPRKPPPGKDEILIVSPG